MQRDRHIVGTQVVFVANKQTKVKQKNLLHSDCGGKQERNLLREAEGGDRSHGGLGRRGQKGKQPEKAGPGTAGCSCLGPAATEAGCLGLRLVWVSLTLNYLLSSAHYSLKGDLADLSELPSRLKAEPAVTARAAFSPGPDMRTSSDLLANQI